MLCENGLLALFRESSAKLLAAFVSPRDACYGVCLKHVNACFISVKSAQSHGGDKSEEWKGSHVVLCEALHLGWFPSYGKLKIHFFYSPASSFKSAASFARG